MTDTCMGLLVSFCWPEHAKALDQIHSVLEIAQQTLKPVNAFDETVYCSVVVGIRPSDRLSFLIIERKLWLAVDKMLNSFTLSCSWI